MAVALLVAAGVLGYVLGSIPTGVVVCRPLGLDPRKVGSGRTGGTNVQRTAGWVPAILTVLGDVAKGYVAVALASRIVPEPWTGLGMSVAALGAILGHNYSVFLGFAGGAGSSPNLGALAAFSPPIAAIGLAVGAFILFGVRVASLASLSLSLTVVAGLGWQVAQGARPASHLVYAAGQLALVVWALRPNIARLLAGTERRLQMSRGEARGEAAGEAPGEADRHG
jgi:glycerol-3-phosphate acyltransferase PlsY